jgi:hypothetical protein
VACRSASDIARCFGLQQFVAQVECSHYRDALKANHCAGAANRFHAFVQQLG